MIEPVIANGLAADWVTGDSVCGSARSLRVWLEQRRQPFVLGIKSDEALWCGLQQVRATQLKEAVPDDAWQCISAGDGAQCSHYRRRMALGDS